ncbi:MAG TPA: alpha/beta hydrolase [Candidatus Dormibacteraeota bacterium]|nr:alpha/beta hydrolase [Candidatus Dormibacteraeota bacterium]
MKLHVREWGTGNRAAVLIHGITSDSNSWWRFGPDLAARGYHVLAPDLRGHGLSPRGEYGPEVWAEDLLDSIPANPELALGHSLGGLVLAVALERLQPARAIYEDPAWRVRPERHAQAVQEFAAQKGWGREQVAAANPRWPAGDVDAKLEALQCWDPGTAPAVLDGASWDYTPARPVVPSLVQLADPSDLVPPDQAERLVEAGFEVRVVAGAGHSIHRDDYQGFVGGLDAWL